MLKYNWVYSLTVLKLAVSVVCFYFFEVISNIAQSYLFNLFVY